VESIKGKKNNSDEYHEITGFDVHFNILFNKLEMIFVDLQTSLAIVEMFSYEEWALKENLKSLNKFKEVLDKEMKSLKDWLTEGTFTFLFLKGSTWPTITIFKLFLWILKPSIPVIFDWANASFLTDYLFAYLIDFDYHFERELRW
jgi:hypothetical protein